MFGIADRNRIFYKPDVLLSLCITKLLRRLTAVSNAQNKYVTLKKIGLIRALLLTAIMNNEAMKIARRQSGRDPDLDLVTY